MPTHTITVIARIQAQPAVVTAAVWSARSDRPISLNEYWPAIWARFAITTTSAATITQPVIQPVCGPKARATQVKLVPQSGSASFSARYASEMNSIGTNARSKTTGALV